MNDVVLVRSLPAVVKWMVRQHIIRAPVKTKSNGVLAATLVTTSCGSESTATSAASSTTSLPKWQSSIQHFQS